MKSVPPLDAVGDALGCLCLRWATAVGEENKTDVNRLEEKNNRTAEGTWCEVSFSGQYSEHCAWCSGEYCYVSTKCRAAMKPSLVLH